MRILFFLLSLGATIALVVMLDTTRILPAPLGKLLSPQQGIWQNAEPLDHDYNADLKIPGLKGNTEVYFDERLVPHIFSDNEVDPYFVQGYLHARFRLWQMEFQTHFISGRICEIVGKVGLESDRNFRRMGLTSAAETSLAFMEKDDEIKGTMDAYTAGVNAFIENLPESQLPLEYKLLGYKPEKWTNLKSVLFFKAMSYDLVGRDDDFEQTNLLKILGEADFNMLFPQAEDSLSPIIPKGIPFTQSVPIPQAPADADSVYFHRRDPIWFRQEFKPDPDNGSNNWVVAGSKTKSGKPILCNDPHLNLSLPSIWMEMQITTPTSNTYGVSFPGLPIIVIGFNDYVAFGVTNAGRELKDYYEIKFKDESRTEYWFDSAWKKADLRIEQITVKGGPAFIDTVAYTVFGPVIYDRTFQDRLGQNKAYALTWIAHYPSNPLKMWHILNRAKSYGDYLDAIQYFNEPAQNIVFASKEGDIAIKQEGNFPLRWEGQGNFVMPGTDSSYMWKGFIPRQDNPFAHNPEQGYLSSANQRAVDTSYPYFIPGSYDMYRGISINRRLSAMNNITPDDMMRLQNDNYNVFAEHMRPVMLRYILRDRLSEDALRYLTIFEQWNLKSDIREKGPTVFENWLDSLRPAMFNDEFGRNNLPVMFPTDEVISQSLIRDSSSFKFVDNIFTPQMETLSELLTASLEKATPGLKAAEDEKKLEWGSFKNTSIYHLLRDNMLPFARQGLPIGGGKHIINATKHKNGPSWKMIVHLTTPTEAYGIFPGGQHGNPGSPFYDNTALDWANGRHYRLWVMQRNQKKDKRVRGTMTFSS
jgi:penicillin amidase